MSGWQCGPNGITPGDVYVVICVYAIMKISVLKSLVEQIGQVRMSYSQVNNDAIGLGRIVKKVIMGNGLYAVNELRKGKVVKVAVNGSGILGVCDQYRAEDTVQKEQETPEANNMSGWPGQQLHFQFLILQ
jgi:hypothetical protein